MFLGDILPNTSLKIKILKKTSFVFENISGTAEVDKQVDTPLESLPPYESKSKKNLKNTAPFPRYRDSCKNKSHQDYENI